MPARVRIYVCAHVHMCVPRCMYVEAGGAVSTLGAVPREPSVLFSEAGSLRATWGSLIWLRLASESWVCLLAVFVC